jgi:hypothetical protein
MWSDLASPSFSSRSFLLNGRGADSGAGHYHVIQQTTSYVSDHVLLCMAEVLHHMARRAMKVLETNGPLSQWISHAHIVRQLVIFDVHGIPDLICIDTDECRRQTAINAQRLIPASLITNPDHVYEPLQKASESYRAQNKKGVVYPSARHSRGFAVALFGDHTNSIQRVIATMQVTLSLVDEETQQAVFQPSFNPDSRRISYTQGFYMVSRNALIANNHLLQPYLPRETGIIDFVRRPYSSYPDDREVHRL